MSIYSYVSLLPLSRPSIRLLELSLTPGLVASGFIQIHGDLRTYPLENAPRYEALSYVWGANYEMKLIMLNGFEVPISARVHEALEHILENKHKGSGNAYTRIWIDGICINQMDTTEKSSQVAQMRDVYKNAHQCLVWLGPSDETTFMALDTLERFAADDGTPDGSQTSTALQGEQTNRREAMRIFLDNSWFQRIWVIQEVVVAENVVVQCGHLEISWDSLYNGIRRMTGCGYYPYSSRFTSKISSVGQWREIFLGERDTAKKNAALEVRIMTMDGSQREATDARDKIYALRGIASAAIADSMVVDYSRTAEQVYIDFARQYLSLTTDLRLLSLVRQGQRQKSKLRLPSWVPDWSVGMDDGGVLQRYYRFDPTRFFKAALDTRPLVNTKGKQDEISISGIRIGCIKYVVEVCELLRNSTTKDISVSKSHLMSLANKILPSKDYCPSQEPSWVALFRTITADRSALSDRINGSYRMTFLNHLSSRASSTPWGEFQEQLDRPEFADSVRSTINRKVLFTMDRNYLGLTEQGCCIGDTVCIFLGGAVPFIIRTQSDGTYRLHGEAYVHGMMDGEVLKKLLRKDQTSEIIRLV